MKVAPSKVSGTVVPVLLSAIVTQKPSLLVFVQPVWNSIVLESPRTPTKSPVL